MNAEQAAALIPQSARDSVERLERQVEEFCKVAGTCGKSVDECVSNGGLRLSGGGVYSLI